MSVPAPERIRGGVIYGLYALDDPTQKIRYVGKTIQAPQRRMSGHLHNARTGSMTPVSKWIRRHDQKVGQKILETADTYEDLCAAEIRLIAELGTLTTEGGLNCTAGGDGSVGWVHDPEALEKIRQKAIGRKRSPESIAKAVASRSWYRPSEETKALWSAQRKGRKYSPEGLAGIQSSRAKGDRNGLATLTNEQVTRIKERLWDGVKQRDIMKEFGASQRQISSIATETTWVHIPWPTDRPRTVVSPSELRAALSDEAVRRIRALYDRGTSADKIAKMLGVSRSQAQRIGKRERYRYVQ